MLRPSTGTVGRPIELQLNAFRVTNFTDAMVYHYDVTITPEVPGAVKRDVWSSAEQQEPLKDIPCAYDGQKNLYVLQTIPGDEPINLTVNLSGDRKNAQPFTVSIKLAGKINLYELVHFFGNRGNDTTSDISNNMQDAIVALNVMIRHRASLMYPSKGASIYPTSTTRDQKTRFNIAGGIEMWRGYFSSLRLAPDGLVLNINGTVMPFIQEGNLLDVCASFLEKRGGADQLLRDGLQDRDLIRLDRFLRGAKISISRQGGPGGNTPRITGKVRSISRRAAQDHTFELESGETTNVADYFLKHYNKQIRGRNLPCVQLSKKAFFPLELCDVQLGNKYTRKLGPNQIADVLKFTAQKPRDRIQSITQGLQRLNYSNCRTVQAWDFTLEDRPLTVNGRKLECPALTFGAPNGSSKTVQPQDATWRYDRDTAFLNPQTINEWLVLVFQNPKIYPMEKVQNSVRMLITQCKNTGIKFANERPKIVHVNPTTTRTPEDLLAEMKKHLRSKPSLIVTYIPFKNSPMYPIIKTCGDVLGGIPTQNLVIQKTQGAKPPYYSNVALKINVKLGGRNFKLQRELPGCGQDPVMVVGADVTHPNPGSHKPSIAGVVASHEGSACGYSTCVRVQNARQEYINDLQEMMDELIGKYQANTNKLPQRIFFYRDGVSEGMFNEVLQKEVPAIKKAFKDLAERQGIEYSPSLTFIVCGKRHHYRFFPTRDGDRNGNAPAGTVLDIGITHPKEYDWYMLSHSGLLGTSRPSHYSVLFDENKLSPDDLQALTFALCFLYPRSTRSVSIASPAYFAHHVCTRARTHLGMTDETDETSSQHTSGSRDSAAEAQRQLAESSKNLKPVHRNIVDRMYFM